MDWNEKVRNLKAKSSGETIGEHTDMLLKDFDKLMNLYGEHFSDIQKKMIRKAIEYHDYGKSIYGFQSNPKINSTYTDTDISEEDNKILHQKYKSEEYKNFPHGFASPAFLSYKDLKQEFGERNAKIIINAIFYHHNRPQKTDKIIKDEIIENDLKKRFSGIKLSSRYLSVLLRENNNTQDIWSDYAIVIGILNRCDYHASSDLDTRCKGNDKKESASSSNNYIPIEISPFNSEGMSISDIVYKKITSNYKVRDVQEYMFQRQDKNLIVTASTGIGKTEAALMWAGNSKLFYTLPLRVSINAIYKRISGKNKNEYGFENCTLLHSDAFSQLLCENDDFDEARIKYNATRMFSYPLTVCTVDQLFTFVYRYYGCELLLATLKYSKLVIDEIQSYTPDIVAKLIIGLKMISECGGKFAIITATMPPVFKYFIDLEGIKYESSPQPFLTEIEPRHFIKIIDDDFDYDKIESFAQTKKVLIICNTVDKAISVYRKLEECSPKLLHSRFIQKHRNMLEKQIMSFSNSDKTGIWISTQIVEASLDIDFDILFTEMPTADSLLQRLGRCYRKRIYTSNEPNIYIHVTGTGIGMVYDRTIYDISLLKLREYDNSFFTEKDKMAYIDHVYDVETLRDTKFFDEIKKMINTEIPMGLYNKEEAKKKFRDISTIRVMPFFIYNHECNNNVDFDNIVQKAHNGKGKDSVDAMEYLNANTLSLGAYVLNMKEKKYILDKSGALWNMEIYTANNKYEFDEENLCGAGLTSEFDEKSSMY